MPAIVLNWDDILARKDLINADLEYTMSGKVFRGPISKIQRSGDRIIINLEWAAEMRAHWWEFAKMMDCISVDVVESHPYEVGTGTIYFGLYGLGVVKIFPKNSEKLDPKWVHGLVKQS